MNTIDKDYNTRRPHMVIPEYGRNIQKMVEHAITIEDRNERNFLLFLKSVIFLIKLL